MSSTSKPYQVLCIEDNSADVELLKFLFAQATPKVELHFVSDGILGSDFLFKRGQFELDYPTPDMVLMDLNMPKKDGRALIRELKTDKELCRIPVIMLSTSSSDREVGDCYCLGASAFISKPPDLEKFQQAIQKLVGFFFDCVSLPTRPGKHC